MALRIEATDDTPLVILDENGTIHFEGRSLPENVSLFYNQIFEWIENYVQSPAEYTQISIYLNYYNSSSFKCINDILYKLKDLYKDDNMKIEWIYEEDDHSIYETGLELERELGIPFELTEKPVVKEKKEKILVKNKKSEKIYHITKEYWSLIIRNGHQSDFELIQNESI